MTGTVTTAFCYSAKAELPQAAHCFDATVTGQSCVASSTTAMTVLSGTGIAGLSVGMAVTGTNAGAGAVISAFVSQTALTMSVASSGALIAPTFTGDVFKIALINGAATFPVSSFSGTQTNVGTPATGASSTSNLGTDDVPNGSGYTTGGLALTNVSPQVGTTAGFWSFTSNPSWGSSASFSTLGAIIYNTSVRLGASSNGISANASGSAINRTVSVHGFGGVQTVAVGTLTVVLPTNGQGTAILQIS